MKKNNSDFSRVNGISNSNKHGITSSNKTKVSSLDEDNLNASMTIVDFGLGDDHSCVLTKDQRTYCWGSNEDGQLGINDDNVQFSTIPIPIGRRNLKFTDIEAGRHFTCGLSALGRVFCWGKGYEKLKNVSKRKFKVIDVGNAHGCGLTFDGHAYCWGTGRNGQLGNGSDEDSDGPVQVKGGHQFEDLTISARISCGTKTRINDLEIERNPLYCWGHGKKLLILDKDYIPKEKYKDLLQPEIPEVQGATDNFKYIVSGGETNIFDYGLLTCGLYHDGTAYCWGYSAYGKIGDGKPIHETDIDYERVPPTKVDTKYKFKSLITSSSSDGVCGVLENEEIWCWGRGDFGQFGNGANEHANVPTRLDSNINFVQFGMGGHRRCGLDGNGQLFCWGENFGRLGDGTFEHQSTPVKINLPVEYPPGIGIRIKASIENDSFSVPIDIDYDGKPEDVNVLQPLRPYIDNVDIKLQCVDDKGDQKEYDLGSNIHHLITGIYVKADYAFSKCSLLVTDANGNYPMGVISNNKTLLTDQGELKTTLNFHLTPQKIPDYCFEISVSPDNFHDEIEWEISGGFDTKKEGWLWRDNEKLHKEEVCLSKGPAQFKIYDYGGDGICCESGIGSYSVKTLKGTEVYTGGRYFISEESISFDVPFTDSSSKMVSRGGEVAFSFIDITSDGACDSDGEECLMKDATSGLTWTKSWPADTYPNASKHCEDLKYGGIQDWRIPSKVELHEAIYFHELAMVGYYEPAPNDDKETSPNDSEQTPPATNSLKNNQFFIPNINQNFRTTFDIDHGSKTEAINIFSGEESRDHKTELLPFLCVSGKSNGS